MAATLQRKRIRLEALADKYDKMKDKLTSATPILWRGNDVQFEIGIKFADAIITDVSNIDSITLVVRESAISADPPLMTATVAAAAINQNLDPDDWENGADQHLIIPFTATETNLVLDPDEKESFHLAIEAITTDTPARYITLGVTSLEIREDGIGMAGTPPTNDPLYLTGAQSDARYARLAPMDGSYRIKTDVNGTFLQFWNATTEKWHTFFPSGVEGSLQSNWGPGEN